MELFWDTLETPFDIYIYICVLGHFSVSPKWPAKFAGSVSYRDDFAHSHGVLPRSSKSELWRSRRSSKSELWRSYRDLWSSDLEVL